MGIVRDDVRQGARGGGRSADAARSLLLSIPIHNVFQLSGGFVRMSRTPSTAGAVTYCNVRDSSSVRCQTPCTNSKITSTYIFCTVPVQTEDKFSATKSLFDANKGRSVLRLICCSRE